MSDKYVFLSIAVMTLVTALLRVLPFVIFNGKRKTPAVLQYLGRVLPYAIMGMLVVYCLKGITFEAVSGFLPELIASAVVIASYVWKRNTLISIIGGTICYMLLVQFVF